MKKVFSALTSGFLLLSFVLTFTSCGSSLKATRGALYPKMYEYAPSTILIMPPINQTNVVEAPEYFYSSLAVPLMERGYYVFSPYLSLDLLQSESAANAENFIDNKSLAPFANVFGADAVLFTKITKWNKLAVLSQIEVEIEYILKSTRDSQVLFDRKVNLTVDKSSTIQGAGIWGILGNMLVTALTDEIYAARKANNFVLSDLPSGKYREDYAKDKETGAYPKVIDHITVN